MKNYSESDRAEIRRCIDAWVAPIILPSKWVSTPIGIKKVCSLSQEEIDAILSNEVWLDELLYKGDAMREIPLENDWITIVD